MVQESHIETQKSNQSLRMSAYPSKGLPSYNASTPCDATVVSKTEQKISVGEGKKEKILSLMMISHRDTSLEFFRWPDL